MPGKRPKEPIAPTTIPGEATDPKIPEDQQPPRVDPEINDESDEERQARDSEAAFDRAIARTPPG
jgi:hypothetical protein